MGKVYDLPAWVPAVEYSILASIVRAEMDGVHLEIRDGNTVVLPWGEEYRPKADFRPILICDHAFYSDADKWVKTEKSWVYVDGDVTYEEMAGGTLGKWWEIRYIILPPFPEIPSYKKTEWSGWTIHGAIWDKKEVSFYRGRWVVRLPIFFRELETTRELEFLAINEVWFADQEGELEDGTSQTHSAYFLERISYLAEKLGVPDPAVQIKQKREAAKVRKEAEERADQETVEVPYYFRELSYYDKRVEFRIKGGKVYRLYGDKAVILAGVAVFGREIPVSMTRKESRRLREVHLMDLGSHYTAIYKPGAEEVHKVVETESTNTSIRCSCGETVFSSEWGWNPLIRKFREHKEEAERYEKSLAAAFGENRSCNCGDEGGPMSPHPRTPACG